MAHDFARTSFNPARETLARPILPLDPNCLLHARTQTPLPAQRTLLLLLGNLAPSWRPERPHWSLTRARAYRVCGVLELELAN
jgi:hypothetical protein